MKLKQTFVAATIAAIMTTAVQAETGSNLPTEPLASTDLALLFEQDAQPLQLAALSEQEMKETEGAWGPWGAAIGSLSGLASYTAATMISGASWSWGDAAVKIGSGAVYGMVNGPAAIVWGFNGAVTEGVIEGMVKRYPW